MKNYHVIYLLIFSCACETLLKRSNLFILKNKPVQTVYVQSSANIRQDTFLDFADISS